MTDVRRRGLVALAGCCAFLALQIAILLALPWAKPAPAQKLAELWAPLGEVETRVVRRPEAPPAHACGARVGSLENAAGAPDLPFGTVLLVEGWGVVVVVDRCPSGLTLFDPTDGAALAWDRRRVRVWRLKLEGK